MHVTHYEELAKSVLSIQCITCHTRKSLYITTDNLTTATSSNINPLDPQTLITNQKLQQLHELIKKYDDGCLDLTQCYLIIKAEYLNFQSSTTNNHIFENIILPMIIDPERKSSLHMRHLLLQDFVCSPCCRTPHCFRCKTATHPGQTCTKRQEDLDNSILYCPSCDIPIVKGDGKIIDYKSQ